jgi:phosphoglycolate phosphatase-like HAD superfamily hydrolase
VIYLFDIDGTILLSGGAGSRALNRVFFDLYGVKGAMDSVNPAGKTDPIIIAEAFRAGLDREPRDGEYDTVIDAYVPLLNEELADSPRFRLMPNIIEVLDFLADASGVLLGIATGNVRAGAQAKLEHAGLWQRFTFGGYGCDHADRGELVRTAVQRGRTEASAEIPDERVVVVGDTVHDVTAARAAGVRVIAVATGSVSRSELEGAGADEVFDTLADLPAWHRAELS